MKYLEFINSLIKNKISKSENLVLFGQNITAGSCLGGLTRGLPTGNGVRAINTTNSENSLCGFGFGLMMNNVSSIFFMKQLDFLLLGIDHLVNTYNIIRNTDLLQNGSFTIMPIIVDNGFQGPQSSLNNFGDFCSISRIDGYTITNKIDAEKIINTKLTSPGFKIIAISQRLFKEEIIDPGKIISGNYENTIFQYSDGIDVTIVSFNFAFPYGWEILQNFKQINVSASFFNVNSPTPTNWETILNNVTKTRKLIIIDDSKSKNLACDTLIADICMRCDLKMKIVVKRRLAENWLNPVSDTFEIDFAAIINEFKTTCDTKN